MDEAFTIKSLLRDCLQSFLEAWIRFWDNRFVIDKDEIRYLRNLIESERRLNNELIASLFNNEAKPSESESKSFQPIIRNKNWRQLARERQAEIHKEAQIKAAASKSTDELEQELGIG